MEFVSLFEKKGTSFKTTKDLRAFLSLLEDTAKGSKKPGLGQDDFMSKDELLEQDDSGAEDLSMHHQSLGLDALTQAATKAAASATLSHISTASLTTPPLIAHTMNSTGTAAAHNKSTAAGASSSGAAVGQDPANPDGDADKSISPFNKKCKCKRSRCLKFYCECFAANVPCNTKYCTCVDCWNTLLPWHASARAEAIAIALDKNPDAFAGKLAAIDFRGCSCKKSGCLKKYCECYAIGKNCTDICRCTGCENRPEGYVPDPTTVVSPKALPRGPKPVSAGDEPKKRKKLKLDPFAKDRKKG